MKTEASQELPIIDLNEARNFLFGLTQEAGEILKTHFKSGNLSETGKGGLDFATQADTQVDAFLLEKLRAKYPDSNFLTRRWMLFYSKSYELSIPIQIS